MLRVGLSLGAATIAETHKDRRAHVAHGKVRDANAFERSAVHHFERETGSSPAATPALQVAEDAAIIEQDVLETAAALGAELERVAGGGEHAIGDGEMFGGAQIAKRWAGFWHDCVVPGLDET